VRGFWPWIAVASAMMAGPADDAAGAVSHCRLILTTIVLKTRSQRFREEFKFSNG
jgi:hypothetical protein